jgi:ferredoxin
LLYLEPAIESKDLNQKIKLVDLRITKGGQTQSLKVRLGLGFQAFCARNPTPIEFDCREADCGICIFKVQSGASHLTPKTAKESEFLKAMRADPDERLACQVRVLGDVSIEVEDF